MRLGPTEVGTIVRVDDFWADSPVTESAESKKQCLGGEFRNHLNVYCLGREADTYADVGIQFDGSPSVAHLYGKGSSEVQACYGKGWCKVHSFQGQVSHVLLLRLGRDSSADSALAASLPAESSSPQNVKFLSYMAQQKGGPQWPRQSWK